MFGDRLINEENALESIGLVSRNLMKNECMQYLDLRSVLGGY